jgi:hypothetical protein
MRLSSGGRRWRRGEDPDPFVVGGCIRRLRLGVRSWFGRRLGWSVPWPTDDPKARTTPVGCLLLGDGRLLA